MYYSTAVAYVLWLFGGCGALGLHRFYLRKFGTGFIWMFSGGLGFLGAVYDFFTLPRQVEEANIRAGVREALDMRARERLADLRFDRRPSSSGSGGFERRETMEKIILRTAKKNGGFVTPGEVAIESEYTTEQCRDALEKLAAKGFAEMRVRRSGVIVFCFPEFVRGEDSELETGL